MAFKMNEYFSDGSIKDEDIIKTDESFTEGFSEDRAKKKEKKKTLRLMRDAVIRIMGEMWKLFPRTATLFSCAITREKGKWTSKTWMYMAKDIRNEKPVQESSYQKTFNISKAQMDHLKDVCKRTLEYVERNSTMLSTDIDILVINVFFDGSANYRFGKRTSIAKSNYAKEIVDEMGAIPDNVENVKLKIDDSMNDFSGII